jgi:cytochrome c-type biogenesis protein CcmE
MADTAVPPTRRPSHRLRYTIIAMLCIGAVVWMITLMQKNVVFYKTVSDAVASRQHDGTRTLRIGGAVVPGSIHVMSYGVVFDLTQGGETVRIDHHGSEPALFKNCAPVVADGHWQGDGVFLSDQILIKHGSEYQETLQKLHGKCPEDPFGRGT